MLQGGRRCATACCQTENGTATSYEEARRGGASDRLPRPGAALLRARRSRHGNRLRRRGMLRRYIDEAVDASPERPILVDQASSRMPSRWTSMPCADGDRCVIGGVMEHIEECGVHSGDSCCTLPTFSLSDTGARRDPRATHGRWLLALDVRGLMNVQYAVKRRALVYLLEVNPARQSHDAIREQGHRRSACSPRCSSCHGGRQSLDDLAVPRRGDPALLLRQGAGVPLQPVPGHRHHPRSRDAQHG